MAEEEKYQQASIKTADNLRTIAQSMGEISHLSLPEIESLVERVGQIIPAGNVPGVILNGFARLSGRRVPANNVRRDVNMLFKGAEQVLDQAVYAAFFAGPAGVILGYQELLKLAGKRPEDAFPEGTWQFYVDYALREDTARHANETHGFDTTLNQYDIALSTVDRATAWVMTCIYALHQYEDLLVNEWYERVATHILYDLEPTFGRLHRAWAKRRPYERGSDTQPGETYPAYRRRHFEAFLTEQDIPRSTHKKWRKQLEQAQAEDLPAFIEQMSIIATLDPDSYGEKRLPILLEQSHVGLIYQGRYYLIPACTPGTAQPPAPDTVRAQIAAIVNNPIDDPTDSLIPLVQMERSAYASLRKRLSEDTAQNLELLYRTPILINLDQHAADQPLAKIRHEERGEGSHALTIFDTGKTFVFDQSHIFFDGAWGAAFAEILTNEALSWAVYFSQQGAPQPTDAQPLSPTFNLTAEEQQRIAAAPTTTPEASAENSGIDIKAILALRKLFKTRNDLLALTVNDMLILYRAIHAATYVPAPKLVKQLEAAARVDERAAAALEAVERQENPAILIPVDASQRSPRDRLYPMTFEVPLNDLDLLTLHEKTLAALDAYRGEGGQEAFERFDRYQRVYLAALAGFGTVMSQAKEIAVVGESASVGTIKMLAHMPTPLQRLLDTLPGRFDVLNDIIKGREVFSNVGAVAPTSTLTRFISAKDDNEKKVLVWGVITDAEGVMRITLRDFRPYVAALQAVGRADLADQVAADYLSAYVEGLNDYIADLRCVTAASRETRLYKST